MKTSRYAVWTAALALGFTLALGVGGGLGLSRKAHAQPPTIGYDIPIPTECVFVPGGIHDPGRKGIGVLHIPIPPAAQSMINLCVQTGAGVKFSVNPDWWLTDECGAPTLYEPVMQLYSEIDYEWNEFHQRWEWVGTLYPECVLPHLAPPIILGVAESETDSGYLTPHGSIRLTCCTDCPPGGPGNTH